MGTFTFTNEVEVTNGEVVDSTEINQISENTDHLKLNYLKVGYNLDSDDVGNGYQTVFVKKAFSLDIDTYSGDPFLDYTQESSSVAVNVDLYSNAYLKLIGNVTITLPTTSDENDAETKGNTLITDGIVVPSVAIVNPSLTPDDASVASIGSYYASVISVSNTTIVVRVAAEFVSDYAGPNTTWTFAGEVHLMVLGTY